MEGENATDARTLPGDTAPVRPTGVAIVLAALLVAPASAAAHSAGLVAVAVDSHVLSVTPAGAGTATIDLARGRIRLRVGAGPIVVLGLAREPMLRFHDGIVEVSLASPSARVFKIVSKNAPATGWRVIAHGREFAWHDERAVPPAAAARSAGPGWHPWQVPIDAAGTAGRILGEAALVPAPSRMWVVGALLAAIALAALGWRTRERRTVLAVTAAVSATAAVVVAAGLANASTPVTVAAGTAAALLGGWLLARYRQPVSRLATAAALALVGILVASASVEVLVLAVPLSSLAPTSARIATAAALTTSLAALALAAREAMVSGMFDDDEPAR